MHAIQIAEYGGPEVLLPVEMPQPSIGPDEVLVRNDAAGVNFIDTYQRTGLYPVPLPYTPGLEGAGTIDQVGANVSDLAKGDRVAWTGVLGSYAEWVAVPAKDAVPLPDTLSSEVACACLLQGLTAHYLAFDTYPLQPGDQCLIHAGAGGVGLLLTQLAKSCGAVVVTTVGSEAKAELSRAAGADHVVNYSETNFAEAIVGLLGPRPFAVVYDGVGQSVFADSLTLLRTRGLMATYGNASGPVEPVSPLALSQAGSLYLTRPTLFDYIASRDELLDRSADLFDRIVTGSLDVRIGERLPLAEAGNAHRMLEGRATTGKVILNCHTDA